MGNNAQLGFLPSDIECTHIIFMAMDGDTATRPSVDSMPVRIDQSVVMAWHDWGLDLVNTRKSRKFVPTAGDVIQILCRRLEVDYYTSGGTEKRSP